MRDGVLICIFMLLGWQSVSTPPESDDIVITATRAKDKCVVRYADREMSDAELDKRAASWKLGKSVRLIARDVDFDCARKIATKLFARGVMRVIFLDPSGKPARPFESGSNLPDYRIKGTPGRDDDQGGYLDTRAREHNFISRSAAGLIQQGKCGEARDFALREGDLDAAAAVVAICRVQDK